MNKTIIIASILLLPLQSFTEETHAKDYLTLDGEGHYIRADPMYFFLSTGCRQDRLDNYVNNFCIPYWPNYTKYWELKDTSLYLVKIEANDGKEYPLELLFPSYDGSPIEAKWFSGNVSYRLGESPVIMLNREYYAEESVIRFFKGKEVGRFGIDHRERWISYARRIMDEHRPLEAYRTPEGESLEFPLAYPDSTGTMVDLLDVAFMVVTRPQKKTLYCPLVDVRFNIDLDDFQLTEAHRTLSSYELLDAIAKETKSVLDVALSNRLVIYEINENKSAGDQPPASPPTAAE